MVIRYWVRLLLFFLLAGCGQPSEYQQRIEKELSSGVRQDSLFMGISFGMSKMEFYSHCEELNRKGIFHEGPQGTSVEYKLSDLKHDSKITFFPNFYENKIYEMPVVIAYDGWAPWNKNLSADSLRVDVLELFEKWYGKGFIEVQNPGKGTTLVKIDGNRQIEIYEPEYDNEVIVLFTDLLVEKIK